jgi:hypothetical protein
MRWDYQNMGPAKYSNTSRVLLGEKNDAPFPFYNGLLYTGLVSMIVISI